jgi:hypothetical protein
MAADWVKGKKGFFTIEDMMDEIIKWSIFISLINLS